MVKRIKTAFMLLIVVLTCGATALLHAQQPDASLDASPTRYFRLDFRVLQVSPDGKIADSRSYSEMVVSGPKSHSPSSLRAQDRVPVHLPQNEVQYENAGADIDVKNIEVSGEMLRLDVTANVSAVAPTAPDAPLSLLTRQTNWSSDVSVPIGKPTIVLSSDNDTDHGKTELELTAVSVP
jgi:hypothetical protein